MEQSAERRLKLTPDEVKLAVTEFLRDADVHIPKDGVHFEVDETGAVLTWSEDAQVTFQPQN